MELKGNISLHYLVNKAAVGRMHALFHHIRWSPLGPAAEGARCPVKPHPCSHHGEPLQDPVPLECAPSSSLWPRGRSPQAAEAAVTPSNSETKDQHTTHTHTPLSCHHRQYEHHGIEHNEPEALRSVVGRGGTGKCFRFAGFSTIETIWGDLHSYLHL